MLTSPSFQSQLPDYLNTVSPTPVFNPTASPGLTATFSPTSPAAGGQVTVTGQLTNKQPGFATLANQTVDVDEIVGTVPLQVATGTTDSAADTRSRSRRPRAAPTRSRRGNLGDRDPIPEPCVRGPAGAGVEHDDDAHRRRRGHDRQDDDLAGSVNVSGKLSPKAPDANATVSLLAKKKGSMGSFALIGSASLKAGQTSYALSGSRPGAPGRSRSILGSRALSTATSTPTNVTIPARSVAVKFKKVTVKKGKLTVSGSVGQAPTKAGATSSCSP